MGHADNLLSWIGDVMVRKFFGSPALPAMASTGLAQVLVAGLGAYLSPTCSRSGWVS